MNLTGHDDDYPTLLGQRLTFRNNFFEDIGTPAWFTDGGAILFQCVNGADSVTIEHNTGFQAGKIAIFDYLPLSKFVFDDNITPHNTYGIFGSGAGVGNDALAMFAPDGVVKGNVIIALPDGISPSQYPDGNFFPASLDDVGFVDLAAGNYRLGPTSAYLGMGTDGKDPGVDWDELEAAQKFRSPAPPGP